VAVRVKCLGNRTVNRVVKEGMVTLTVGSKGNRKAFVLGKKTVGEKKRRF